MGLNKTLLAQIIGAMGGFSPKTIIMFGSSTTARSFDATGLTDITGMLADYGITGVEMLTSSLSGSNVQYHKDTLMPAAIASYSAKPKVLCVVQLAVNSVTTIGDYATADAGSIATYTSNQNNVFDQAVAAGWRVGAVNFNDSANSASMHIGDWNTYVGHPIIASKAPAWISGNTAVIDYYGLSIKGGVPWMFSSSDGTHLKEISGDRLWRAYTASRIAKNQFGYPAKNLSGRRFVVAWGSTDSASWQRVGYVNRLAASSGPTTTTPMKSFCGHILDADTGEVLPGLYVALVGGQGVNTQGRGNAGNNSNSYLNNTACAGSIYHDTTYASTGFYLEIGSFDGAVPNASSVKVSASRNVTGTDRFATWTCNGQSLDLDATAIPAGLVTFNSVPATGGIISATAAIKAGSTLSYFSAVEVVFA